MYREDFFSVSELAMSGMKPGTYFVARLKVSDILALGLSVLEDGKPEPELPGHALIPEIRRPRSGEVVGIEEKQKMKDLQGDLSDLAAKRIVHIPKSPSDTS